MHKMHIDTEDPISTSFLSPVALKKIHQAFTLIKSILSTKGGFPMKN